MFTTQHIISSIKGMGGSSSGPPPVPPPLIPGEQLGTNAVGSSASDNDNIHRFLKMNGAGTQGGAMGLEGRDAEIARIAARRAMTEKEIAVLMAELGHLESLYPYPSPPLLLNASGSY
jgi:hypothetical protein